MILPDSSNSPGVILNSFQVWRKNEFHQSDAISKIAFKFFSSRVLPFLFFIIPEFLNNFGGVSRRLSQLWRLKKSFPSKSCPSSQRFMVLASCYPHNCFDCENFFSSIRSNSIVFSDWFSVAHHLRIIHSSFQLSFSKSYRCIIQVLSNQLGISAFTCI